MESTGTKIVAVVIIAVVGTIVAIAAIPPAAPTLSSSGSVNAVNLTWADPSPFITGYKIYRGTTLGRESLLTTTGVVTTYVDSITTPGKYYYYVIALKWSQESAPSNEMVASPICKPGAPQDLTAVAISGGIILNWTDPISYGGDTVSKFNIYRGLSSGKESLYKTIDSSTSYQDVNVTLGTTYFYYVAGTNAAGEGPQSNEVNITYLTPPAAPQNLAATSIRNGIALAWGVPLSDGGSPITNYTIYRGISSGAEANYQTIGNVTAFNDSIAIPQGQYYYQVRAINSIGEGNPSNEVNATPLTCPSAPLNLTVTQSGNIILLEWRPPALDGQSPITNYRIYRKTNDGNWVPIATIGNVLSYNDTNLTVGDTYSYKVTALNAIGESVFSDEILIIFQEMPVIPANLIWLLIILGVIIASVAGGLYVWKRRQSSNNIPYIISNSGYPSPIEPEDEPQSFWEAPSSLTGDEPHTIVTLTSELRIVDDFIETIMPGYQCPICRGKEAYPSILIVGYRRRPSKQEVCRFALHPDCVVSGNSARGIVDFPLDNGNLFIRIPEKTSEGQYVMQFRLAKNYHNPTNLELNVLTKTQINELEPRPSGWWEKLIPL